MTTDPASRVPGPGADPLFVAVYDELRTLAHRRLRAERDGHTLSTTALVHEAYLRLVPQHEVTFANRDHFLALAAQAMRRILVDYARQHRALKRGGDRVAVSIDAIDDDDGLSIAATSERAEFLIALDDALAELALIDPRLARVVEYRFFTGLTEPETAAALAVTTRTVARDWVKARAWLLERLRPVSEP